MARVHSGSIIQASTFKKNDASPLDDRAVVENKSDLITSSVWTVNNTDTRYEGMLVFVEGVSTPSEKGVYVLTNGLSPNTDESWLKLQNGSGTDTWRGIYVGDILHVGTGTETKAMNFSAGPNVTIAYEAAGTSSGQSGSNEFFNIKLSASNTASAADDILHGSNSGTQITYAPYPSATATTEWINNNGGKIYLGANNPTQTNRLNYNGYFYANKLYSGGTEVKVKQTAVTSPTASGNATSFIDAISQDTNGNITVTKKSLGMATTTAVGGIKVGNVITTPSNASTTDTDTEKRYAVLIDKDGLAYANVPWTDTTYSLPLAANGTLGGIQIGYTQSGKNYPVQLSNEKAYVNVPWTDTTYSSGNEITVNSSNNINHDVKLSSAFTGTTSSTTISGFGGSDTIKVPTLSINQYGHVTSASEASITITMPESKILAYTAPTYPTNHISSTYQSIITNNAIAVNTSYDNAFNKLDNKIAGLTQELITDIEDETRYYAKCSTATASGTLQMSALIVENRGFILLNGTKIDVYFQNTQTQTRGKLRIEGSNGYSEYKELIYENDFFNTSLINSGTTLALVYDSGSITIGGTVYTGFFRVVGGVGGGGSTWRNVKVKTSPDSTAFEVLNTASPLALTLTAGSNITLTPHVSTGSQYDGEIQIDASVPIMTGATISSGGQSGIVPAPTSGDVSKYLCGDGTWKNVSSVDAFKCMGMHYLIDTNLRDRYRPFNALCKLFKDIFNNGTSNDTHTYVNAFIREDSSTSAGHIPLGAIILLYGMYLIENNSESGRFVYETNCQTGYPNYIVCDNETADMWGGSSCTTSQLLTDCQIFLVTGNWNGQLPTDTVEYNASQAGQSNNYTGSPINIPSIGGGNGSNIWHKYTFNFTNVAQGELYNTHLTQITKFINAIRNDGDAEYEFKTSFSGGSLSFFNNNFTGSIPGMLVTVHHESSVGYDAHQF